MAFTYVIVDICFAILVILLIGFRIPIPRKLWIFIVIILFILTIFFDSILIRLNVFNYSASKILGIHIGDAPIEDLFYPLIATIVIPILWQKADRKK
jgi:small toxic polypeptide LdrA/B/C/D